MTINMHYHVNKRNDWGAQASPCHTFGEDIMYLRMGTECGDFVIPDVSVYLTKSQAHKVVDALLIALMTHCGVEDCDACAPSEACCDGCGHESHLAQHAVRGKTYMLCIDCATDLNKQQTQEGK